MVTAIPAAGVVRDAFLAAGAGFLLGVLYRALRAVLGSSRAACFFCDCAVCTLAALVFRSAAVSAFTSGVMRWYTGAALCAAALWSQRLLRGVSRCAHAAFSAPLHHALARLGDARERRRQKRRVRKKKTPCKDLKKAPVMLYNSK